MTSKYQLYCCGSRGSRPVEGSRFNEFGGFTSCYVLKSEDYALIIDCGTGLYEANAIILDCPVVDVVLTHMHYDHVLGMLDWDTLSQKSKITFYAGFSNWFGEKTFEEFFRHPFWPVQPSFVLKEAPPTGERLQLTDDLSVEFFPAPHPDQAQRIMVYQKEEGEEHRIAVMFDNESPEGIDTALLENADYILYDGMYTDTEYADKKGYGHSTWQEACRLALKVNCKRMIVTHHSPFRVDKELRRFESLAREIIPCVDFARSGQHWDFPYVDNPQSGQPKKEPRKNRFLEDFSSRLNDILLDKEKLAEFFRMGTYIILGLVSLFMTVVNVFTNKFLLMAATAVFFLCCVLNAILEGYYKKTQATKTIFMVELMVLLTFFIVSGTPEGFSAIWTLMLPLGGMLVLGKRLTTVLSGLMMVILLFFFETPLGQSYLQYEYTASFMLRFPMAFAAFFAFAYFLDTIRDRLTTELERLKETQELIIANQTSELREQYFDIVRANSKLQLRNRALRNMLGDDLSDDRIRELVSDKKEEE